MNITVIGGGSWGTAIARLLANNNHTVKFYIRDKSIVDSITNSKKNIKYLPGIKLENIEATNDLVYSIKDSEVIVLAVPTNSIRLVLKDISKHINSQIIVNLAKGIEVDTLKLISEISKEILPNNSYVCLSGPSHAEEVGKDIPTAVVASSEDVETAKLIQEIFSTDKFRVYTNNDLVGVEIGGALKNIIALAAGMCDGLGYGDNTKAALMTRAIYEMNKLSMAMGANPHTINGLSGIGDLIVTCTSEHSRNRRAGILIGQGKTQKEASEIVGQVVEGIKTTKSAFLLSKKLNVTMPITEKLYNVLYEDADPDKAVTDLMTRRHKEEIEEIFFE